MTFDIQKIKEIPRYLVIEVVILLLVLISLKYYKINDSFIIWTILFIIANFIFINKNLTVDKMKDLNDIFETCGIDDRSIKIKQFKHQSLA